MPTIKQSRKLLIETLEVREVPAATPLSLLKDIHTGANNSSNPANFVENRFGTFFTASTATTGRELYTTNKIPGTANLAFDLNSGAGDGVTAGPIKFGTGLQDFIYFGGTNGSDNELYKTDGATTTVLNVNPTGSSNPQLLTNLANTFLFFTADDGTNGRELYRTDGTNVGLVQNLSTGGNSTTFDSIHVINGVVYFLAKANGATAWSVYKVNASGNGATPVGTALPANVNPTSFVIGGTNGTDLYFSATNGFNFYNLYRLDTNLDTLTGLLPNTAPLSFDTTLAPNPLAYSNGFVYFATTDARGTELWRSNGTVGTGNTDLFREIDTTAGSSDPQGFVTINDEVYFSAKNQAGDRELYYTDGTNIFLAADVRTTGGSSSPSNLTAVNGQLFFTGINNSNSDTLFQFNPLTKTFNELQSGIASINQISLNPLNQFLFLKMAVGNSGLEPYILDPQPDAPLINSFTIDSGFDPLFPLTLTDKRTNSNNNNTFSGKANAPGQVITFFDNGFPLVPTATAGVNGYWTVNLTGYTLSEGVHNITAKATDLTDTSPASTPFTVTIDLTPPPTSEINLNNFTGTTIDKIYASSVITITGSGAEPDSYINLYQGNNFVIPIVPTFKTDNLGSWTVTLPALADGDYAFRIDNLDAATNNNRYAGSGQDPFRVTIDATSPLAPSINNFTTDTNIVGDRITFDNTITLNGGAEPLATINIYQDGNLIGTTTANASGIWQFTTNQLADGFYSFNATAVDPAGNPPSPLSNTINILIDTVPPAKPTVDPTITVDSGTFNNDLVTNDQTVTLTGTTDALSIVTIQDNGVTIGTATVNGTNWTFTTPTLSQGNHPLTAIASDVAGNNLGPTTPLNVFIDSIAPAVPAFTSFSTDTGVPNDNVTTDQTLTINGTGEEGAVINLYQGVNLLGTATVSGGVWSITTGVLPDGVKILSATATDLAGNTSVGSTDIPAIKVDTVAPATPIFLNFSVDSGNQGDFITNDTTLTINGSAAGEVGSVVSLFEGATLLGTGTVDSNSQWSVTTPVLPDGPHTFTAIVTDGAGNVSAAPLNIPTITIDSTLPTAPVITSITDDTGRSNSDGVTFDTQLVINGTAEPNTTIKVYNGQNYLGNAILIGTDWTFATTTLAAGTYQFTATETDARGNISSLSNVFTVVIDTTAPLAPGFVNFSTDTGIVGDRVTNDTTLTIEGTGENGNIITLREGNVVRGTAIVAGGAWSITTLPLPDGAHVFTATGEDLAGNISASTNLPQITIETVAPNAPVITSEISSDTGSSATDLITNDTTLTLTGTITASQGVPPSGVTIYNNGNLIGTATLTGTSWTFDTTTLTDGVYNFTAKAIDDVGNLSQASNVLVVTVDTIAAGDPAGFAFTDDTALPNDRITADRTLTFSGTGENGTVVKIYEGQTVVGSGTVSGGSWTLTTVPLTDGVKNLVAVATDVAGNDSNSVAIPAITIDGTAPIPPHVDSFTAVTPANAPILGTLTAANVLKLNGSSEPNISIQLFDGPNPVATFNSQPNGTWSFTTGTLPVGDHHFHAIATDKAGNISGDSNLFTITVDTTLKVDFPFLEDTGSKTLLGSDLLTLNPSTDTGNAFKGVAITGLSNVGTWSFSTNNGKTFLPLDPATVTPTHSLLLRDGDAIRFTPPANFTGAAKLDYRAWDQTGGAPGTFADSSVNGSSTPFSLNAKTGTIGVQNTNDRPTLKLDEAPIFPSQSETDTVNTLKGIPVGALLAGRFNDIDASTRPGIAIVGATGDGTWEFKRPGISFWTPFLVKPTPNSAVLLDLTTLIRFVQNPNVKGSATLLYRAWDGSSGLSGKQGVATAKNDSIGLLTETATLNIGNRAPNYVPTGPVTLPAINEDTIDKIGNLVSKLLPSIFPDSDPKTAPGVAITGVDESFGKWQFSNGGSTWLPLSGASINHAFLLKSTAKIRFVPNLNASGSTNFTYKLWDGSVGASGEAADITGNNAFSVNANSANLQVKPVNDQPILDTTGTPIVSVAGTTVGSLLGTSLSDVETSSGNLGIAVVATKGDGVWEFNRGSGWNPIGTVSASSALLLANTDLIRFTPTGTSQPPSLNFKGWDGIFGTATGINKFDTTKELSFSKAIETAYVSVGSAPTLFATAPTFKAINEDAVNNPGESLKSFLGTTITGQGIGIAVTSVNNTSGVWQYALSTKFVNIPLSVSPSNALLLPDSAKLKFVPNANVSGPITNSISYKAWDRSVGVGGEFADTTRVDVNAFSTNSVSPTLPITPINDRPVALPGSSVILTPIALSDANPAGDFVSSLVPANLVNDSADGNTTIGVAVTGFTGDGVWQYNNGAAWTAIVKPSLGKAWLLDPTWKVRFVATNPAVPSTASITYRAWDKSVNNAGDTKNAGSTADTSFSLIPVTAFVSVGNSAPMI